MKQLILFAVTIILTLGLTSCSYSIILPQPSEQEENSAVTDSPKNLREEETEAPKESLEERSVGDVQETETQVEQEPENIQDNAVSSENQTEQDFVNLNLELSKGTLYIQSGSSFAITSRHGGTLDYKISDSTLYFQNNSSREFVLTLPENESYECFQLNVKNGHVYVESTLALQTLNLEVNQGDAKFDRVSVSDESSISIDDGSAALYGDFGDTLTATCRNGQLNLKVPYEKTDYNYEINVSEGNIRLDHEQYHGLSNMQTIDNGNQRLMKLTVSRGDVSMEFGKEEADWENDKDNKAK